MLVDEMGIITERRMAGRNNECMQRYWAPDAAFPEVMKIRKKYVEEKYIHMEVRANTVVWVIL